MIGLGRANPMDFALLSGRDGHYCEYRLEFKFAAGTLHALDHVVHCDIRPEIRVRYPKININ